MRPAVTYTPYGTSLREQTGDIITFTQFEEGNILTKTGKDSEIGDESDNESITTSKQDMDAMNYDNPPSADSTPNNQPRICPC